MATLRGAKLDCHFLFAKSPIASLHAFLQALMDLLCITFLLVNLFCFLGRACVTYEYFFLEGPEFMFFAFSFYGDFYFIFLEADNP